MTDPSPSTHDIFATTRWTVILAAGGSSTPQSDHALEELCGTYWFPLYAYVRRRGATKEDAEDLTQKFFARFLEKITSTGWMPGVGDSVHSCSRR